MSDSYVRNLVEAALLAAGGPLPVAELVRLFDEPQRPTAQAVRAALAALAAEYAGRGIELKETAGGFPHPGAPRARAARSRGCGPSVPRAIRARCSRRWR